VTISKTDEAAAYARIKMISGLSMFRNGRPRSTWPWTRGKQWP